MKSLTGGLCEVLPTRHRSGHLLLKCRSTDIGDLYGTGESFPILGRLEDVDEHVSDLGHEYGLICVLLPWSIDLQMADPGAVVSEDFLWKALLQRLCNLE